MNHKVDYIFVKKVYWKETVSRFMTKLVYRFSEHQSNPTSLVHMCMPDYPFKIHERPSKATSLTRPTHKLRL